MPQTQYIERQLGKEREPGISRTNLVRVKAGGDGMKRHTENRDCFVNMELPLLSMTQYWLFRMGCVPYVGVHLRIVDYMLTTITVHRNE